MIRIAIDMDEVVTDALGKHVALYNDKFSKSVKVSDLIGRSLMSYAHPHERDAVIQFVMDRTFFTDLEPIEGSLEVIQWLHGFCEVFITTAAMEVPNSFDSKYQWLRKHMFFLSPMNFVFCGDKSIINADYLIDDNVRHFARFKGTGILYDAPHNSDVVHNPRVKNWEEVRIFFENLQAGKNAIKSGLAELSK